MGTLTDNNILFNLQCQNLLRPWEEHSSATDKMSFAWWTISELAQRNLVAMPAVCVESGIACCAKLKQRQMPRSISHPFCSSKSRDLLSKAVSIERFSIKRFASLLLHLNSIGSRVIVQTVLSSC